jgi:hypothetical protein
MPQMQLPIFPAGFTEINNRVAVETKDGQVVYVYGHLPVFQHEESDVWSFRMFTSQMIVTGSVKPKEIVETFSVPIVTVKRYVKVYRDPHESLCEWYKNRLIPNSSKSGGLNLPTRVLTATREIAREIAHYACCSPRSSCFSLSKVTAVCERFCMPKM